MPGLADLLPAAGGILGGIGGALVPGLGETGISEAAGSAAGSAAGQKLENMLTGSKGSTLAAGVEGGIGSGVGSVLGKIAGGVGKGALDFIAGKTAPKVAAEAAPVEGAAQAAYDKPFVDALSTEAAQTRLQKQGIQFQPIRDFMQNEMGASNDPNEWSKIANFIAGNPGEGEMNGEAILSKHVANAAANQPDLMGADIVPKLHSIVEGHGSSIVEPAATDTLGKFLSQGLGRAQNESTTGQETYSALGLQNMIKEIGQRYAKNPLTMNPLAQTTAAKMTEHEALPEVKQFLSDLVNNRGGVDEAIAKDVTTPEQAAAIMAKAPTPQAGKYVIDAMNNGSSAAEINAAASKAVQADKIAKEVLGFQKGVKPVIQQGKDVASAQTEADKIATAEANKPHPMEKKTAAIANALTPSVFGGGVMNKLKALASAGDGFVPTLHKLASGGSDILGKLPLTQIGGVAGGGIGGAATMVGQPAAGMPTGQANLTSATQPQGAGNVSPLQQAFQGDINAQNADQAFAMQTGGMGGTAGAAASMGGAAAGLAPQLQAQQQAATILGGIPGAYGQAPPGLMGALEGMIPGTPGFAYNQQQQAAAAAIARLLGITPQQAAGLLPQLITPEAAPGRMQTMGGILGNLGAGG